MPFDGSNYIKRRRPERAARHYNVREIAAGLGIAFMLVAAGSFGRQPDKCTGHYMHERLNSVTEAKVCVPN